MRIESCSSRASEKLRRKAGNRRFQPGAIASRSSSEDFRRSKMSRRLVHNKGIGRSVRGQALPFASNSTGRVFFSLNQVYAATTARRYIAAVDRSQLQLPLWPSCWHSASGRYWSRAVAQMTHLSRGWAVETPTSLHHVGKADRAMIGKKLAERVYFVLAPTPPGTPARNRSGLVLLEHHAEKKQRV
jgi:hypothetical protein